MNIENIRNLVAEGESETLEFKRTSGMRVEAAKTVCAMLNHRGGQVLFGVTPDCKAVGQEVSDGTIERISGEVRRIEPAASPTINRVALDSRREIVSIAVNEGTEKPYQYRGRAYRRVGNTSPMMPVDEYNRLLIERLHGDQRWENLPVSGWSVADLDAAEIRRTVQEAVRRGRLDDPGTNSLEDLLRGLRLIRDGQLMRAGAVLFGQSERLEFDFPQCWLRVARFVGTDRMEFVDNRQFFGNAFALLRTAERFLRGTLPIPGRIEPDRLERIDEPLVPPLATREALANAFCHRDYAIGGGSVGVAVYDDRVEISSSGNLHFGLTPDQLFAPHDSRPWNPRIAHVFYLRGIIEEWGRGTLKMESEALGAGLPRPEIEDAGGCVTVRFRFRVPISQLRVSSTRHQGSQGGHAPTSPSRFSAVNDANDSGLSAVQNAVLDLLVSGGGPMALREIRSALGASASPRQVKRALSNLRDRQLVRTEGRGLAARWIPIDVQSGG